MLARGARVCEERCGGGAWPGFVRMNMRFYAPDARRVLENKAAGEESANSRQIASYCMQMLIQQHDALALCGVYVVGTKSIRRTRLALTLFLKDVRALFRCSPKTLCKCTYIEFLGLRYLRTVSCWFVWRA